MLVPAIAAGEMPAIDSSLFKELMRKLAASVTVITTSEDGVPHGMTATAACSVSAEPPSILIVVNRSARSHAILSRTGMFAVHILNEEQEGLSDNFASSGDFQFNRVRYRRGPADLPILEGAVAHAACEVDAVFDYATHTIFVGRVIDACTTADRPLLHYDRRYRRLAAV